MAQQTALCPPDRMTRILAAVQASEASGFRDLEDMLRLFPNDARLHFLKGSLLAGREDYAGARVEMRRAVDLEPNYALARFQLGFLLLTSGEPFAAQEAWGPLHTLPEGYFLRLFVDGLTALIQDRFADTIRLLEEGIARNREIPVMNRDMQLIIDETRKRSDTGTEGEAASALSPVDMLLQQAALKANRH